MSVNIDNFENPPRPIDSPRTVRALHSWCAMLARSVALTDRPSSSPPSIPLQLEACLRLGVDVDDLYPRPLSHFFDKARGDTAALADVLSKHYEKARVQRIAEVKYERKRVAAEVAVAGGYQEDGAKSAHGSAVDAERAKQAARAAESAAHEKKRLAFLKAKQEREMQETMDFELKRAAAAAKQMEEVKRMEEAEKERLAKREEERLKMIEKRRRAELDKMEEEEKRAEEMRKLAMRELAEERKKHAKEVEEAKKLVLLRKKEEEERAAKHLEEEQKRLVRT